MRLKHPVQSRTCYYTVCILSQLFFRMIVLTKEHALWTLHWFKLAASLEKLVWKQKELIWMFTCIQKSQKLEALHYRADIPRSHSFAFGFNRVNIRLS